MNWCDDDDELMVLRFEDFILSSSSVRDLEIQRVMLWFNLNVSSTEISRIGSVFNKTIGISGKENVELIPEHHAEKFRKMRGGYIVASTLMLFPGFRETMSRFRYELPFIDPYELDSLV